MLTLEEAKKVLNGMTGLPDHKIDDYENITKPLYHFIEYIAIKNSTSIDKASKQIENYCIHSIRSNDSEVLKTKDGMFNEISKYFSEYAKSEGYMNHTILKKHKYDLLNFMFDTFGKESFIK